jgi:hypothetical protein
MNEREYVTARLATLLKPDIASQLGVVAAWVDIEDIPVVIALNPSAQAQRIFETCGRECNLFMLHNLGPHRSTEALALLTSIKSACECALRQWKPLAMRVRDFWILIAPRGDSVKLCSIMICPDSKDVKTVSTEAALIVQDFSDVGIHLGSQWLLLEEGQSAADIESAELEGEIAPLEELSVDRSDAIQRLRLALKAFEEWEQNPSQGQPDEIWVESDDNGIVHWTYISPGGDEVRLPIYEQRTLDLQDTSPRSKLQSYD